MTDTPQNRYGMPITVNGSTVLVDYEDLPVLHSALTEIEMAGYKRTSTMRLRSWARDHNRWDIGWDANEKVAMLSRASGKYIVACSGVSIPASLFPDLVDHISDVIEKNLDASTGLMRIDADVLMNWPESAGSRPNPL